VAVDPLQGPRKFSGRHQVSIPADLMDAVGLTDEDSLFVALNPAIPGTLLLIPGAMIERVHADLLDLLKALD
jgi:antitoxin component of MazEF toxin-antitoxin module